MIFAANILGVLILSWFFLVIVVHTDNDGVWETLKNIKFIGWVIYIVGVILVSLR